MGLIMEHPARYMLNKVNANSNESIPIQLADGNSIVLRANPEDMYIDEVCVFWIEPLLEKYLSNCVERKYERNHFYCHNVPIDVIDSVINNHGGLLTRADIKPLKFKRVWDAELRKYVKKRV